MITYAIVAEEAGPPPGKKEGEPGQGPTSMLPTLLMMGAIFVVFYLLLIRPQKKKQKDEQKKREEMLKSMRKNDRVVTLGGIHGIVATVGETEVTIKVDEKSDVRLRVSRDAISRVLSREDEEEEEEEKKSGDGNR